VKPSLVKSHILTDKNEALDWAKSYFPFVSTESIRSVPWAKTYKIFGESGLAYLKIVPHQQTGALEFMPLLAHHFGGSVPDVIAYDVEQGLLLLHDHQATELGHTPATEHVRSLLTTYATIQSKVATMPELLSGLPRPAINNLLPHMLDFLQPGPAHNHIDTHTVTADYFLGTRDASRYHTLLAARQDTLAQLIAEADQLPLTVNHCDLRTRNAAMRGDGTCVLYDWDDAVAGPAGLSLHALFSGCYEPASLLLSNRQSDNENLQAYLTCLVESGYCDAERLRQALPGTICAGVMWYLVSYGKFPLESTRYKTTVKKILRKRLSDLLDLCDFLSARHKVIAFRDTAHYQEMGQPKRAEKLLQHYLATNPDDANAHAKYAALFHERGMYERALISYQQALRLQSGNAEFHAGLGSALLANLNFDSAITSFHEALTLDGSSLLVQEHLDTAVTLKSALEHAQLSHTVPTITISPTETHNNKLSEAKLALANSLFNRYGVLIIENVFPTEFIQNIRDYFFHACGSYLQDTHHSDALRVGDKRLMITLDIAWPLNTPQLYGSPFVLEFLEKILGDDFILGSLTSVTSLAGSIDQHVHKDHPALFDHQSLNQHSTPQLPSFAVTMLVPLVELNQTVGGTRVIKGSHHCSSDDAKQMAVQESPVSSGSCFFMDYRLSHHGRANRSDSPRPVLSMVYQRPWFRDCVNYGKQPPLKMNDQELARVPKKFTRLFSWIKDCR